MGRKKLYNTPEELREHRRTYFKTRYKTRYKAYYQANVDKIKANVKAYQAANLDKTRANVKAYRAANVDKIKVAKKAYRAANLDKIKAKAKAYYINNKDKIKAYKETNRDKINSYVKNRKKTNIQYKLSINLRCRLNKGLKRNSKTGSAVKDLGCTIDELKTHLESKFQSGMTWDNWSREGWHIDHVKPLASFDLTDKEQSLIACHYTNLQPLWAKDNMAKGDKIIF